MTAPGLRIWQGIEAAEPPVRRHDFAELLAMAEAMLASRQKRFPALIDAGEIEPAAAQAQIDAFTAIVADWRWIVHGPGEDGAEPAHLSTWQARCDALDESLRTIATIVAERRGRFSDALADQAECVIALRWRLEPDNWPYAAVRATREAIARREAAHAG